MNEEQNRLTQVVGVKFKSRGKIYFFDPGDKAISSGSKVVVETSRGLELADCVQGNHFVADTKVVAPLRPVVRAATSDDLRIAASCADRERDAAKICEEKIAQHGLDMKLVDVECNFEGNKIMFFFTSDGRVDFRELVKDLAGIFRTRIELRQIGVRDEAKILGGLGICGRQLCCSRFLDDFQPVSTKMAKTQSLSLNPTKISGSCGRLMCCLRYEQEAYEELVKTVPKNGTFVETPQGYGSVTQVNLLRQKVKVRIDGEDNHDIRLFDADEVAAIPGGRPKPGEPLPHVLVIKEKPKEEEPEKPSSLTGWSLPAMFAADTDKAPTGTPDTKRPSSRRRGGKNHRPGGDSSEPKQFDKEPHGDSFRPGGFRQGGRPGKGKGSSAAQKPQSAPAENAQSAAPAGAPAPAEKKKNPRRRYGRGKNRPGGDKKPE